jgi:hypothetical protein
MVWALPWVNFELVITWNVIARNLPEPLAVVMVDDVALDKFPGAICSGAEMLFPG